MRAQRLRAAALAGAVLVSCGLEADDLLEPAAPVAPSAEGASVSGPTGGELARPRVAAEDPARSRYDRDQWQPRLSDAQAPPSAHPIDHPAVTGG
jgi:hypothetical protein